MNRTVDLHEDAAQARLEDKRVLITGGLGCVGSRLIPLLGRLGASQICIVDIAEESPARRAATPVADVRRVDVRNPQALDTVFEAFKPQVVFHLAAVREPGRAEAVVREAIETNVFGTRNMIATCLRHGVEDAVYSSTGKCFAYLTDHVYTGTKKLAEAQWVTAGRNSATTRFRFTRFTHVMENGVVARDIADGIESGLVGLHGPGRHFNVQNLRQATHLLVNALALAPQTPPDAFLAAVDLGWPVNTLELALYNIVQSGKPAGVRFLGVPKGYDEDFFRGQFRWDGVSEYHPLINALEAPTAFTDSTETMTGARVQPFRQEALDEQLAALERALADPALDVSAVKSALIDAVTGLTRAIFAEADLSQLIDVLWWGAAPAWAGAHGALAVRFAPVIRILIDAVTARPGPAVQAMNPDMRRKLSDVLQVVAEIGALATQAASLRAALK
jgi:nucleoside-diphosphate-sugar epimerase